MDNLFLIIFCVQSDAIPFEDAGLHSTLSKVDNLLPYQSIKRGKYRTTAAVVLELFSMKSMIGGIQWLAASSWQNSHDISFLKCDVSDNFSLFIFQNEISLSQNVQTVIYTRHFRSFESFLVKHAHFNRKSATELNNETTTSLACGKERGLKRARPRNSFDSRENQCRVLKTKTFFFCWRHIFILNVSGDKNNFWRD